MIYTNIYQNHVPCSYNYKLVTANDRFSEPLFKQIFSHLTVVILLLFMNFL